MNDELIDKLETELTGFTSEDGKHEVGWYPWYDEQNKIIYDAWVCLDHNKLYYIDCVYSAQV